MAFTTEFTSSMPQVGIGLWKIERDKTAEMVRAAIAAGYRHIDSACDYGNEIEAGQGIADAIAAGDCTREALWITSKLWNTFHEPARVREGLEKTLTDLRLEYLDLYLIHFPIALQYVPISERYPPEWFPDPDAASPAMTPISVPLADTWRAMEALVDDGLVKRIGVCNYSTGLVHDLMSYARIKPAMLQVESHPYLTQEKLLRLASMYDLPMTAFSPLGASSYKQLDMATEEENVLNSAVVTEIAARHGKSPAQVVLRWGVQRGTAVIPKTSRVERLAENIDVFDFALSDDDMAAIAGMNRNRRFNDPGVFTEAAFNRFHPIFD